MKVHKSTIIARERDVTAREAILVEKEAQVTAILTQKDTEIASLRALISTAEEKHQTKVREALFRREEELRAMVLKQEAEVAIRMARREEEIMEAVRRREEDIGKMWADWERETREGMARAVEERMLWVRERTEELEKERDRLLSVQVELERRCEQAEKELAASRNQGKTPLENVKNLMRQPLWEETPQQTPLRTERFSKPPVFETPMNKAAAAPVNFAPPSAMKGVVLTSTGEKLATPSPTEFAKLFIETPRVCLNFSQIFDFDSEAEDSVDEDGYETDTRPSLAATLRGQKREQILETPDIGDDDDDDDLEITPKQTHVTTSVAAARPTRLRRPSIRASSSRRSLEAPAPAPTITRSRSTATCTAPAVRAKPRSRPPSAQATTSSAGFIPSRQAPEYDLSDEENLPSPFLKKTDRDRISRTTSVPAHALQSDNAPGSKARMPRKSTHTLRAMAVVNAANAAGGVATSKSAGALTAARASRTTSASALQGGTRTSIQRAQAATAEAKRTLQRH